MGQQICGMTNQQITQTINGLAFEDLDVPDDEDGDNPCTSIHDCTFLKTEYKASPSLLRQRTNQCFGSNYTFCRETPKKQELSQKKSLSEVQQKQKQNQEIKAKIQSNLDKKKYRPSISKAYENMEVDISNFIKIKEENVFEFYEFQEKIGEGSFGNVYRGIQKRSNEVRAIKALKKKSMNKASQINLIAEMDILKILDHPNIIKLYDLFLYDGNYYVITEFCEGGCLEKYYSANKGNISEETIKVIMKQIISVLNYLYTQSVVHRDLKMENIVFLKKITDHSSDLQIRLIDFGTAIQVQKHKKIESGLVGTLLYIAPEFTKGFFTQKCDIWSAGVILYRLMFCEFPFKGHNEKEILNQISNRLIDWNKLKNHKFSNEAFQILKSMLDKNYLTRVSAKTLIQNPWIKNGFTLRASRQLSENTAVVLALYNRKNNFVSVIESFLSFKKITQQERHELSKIFFEIDNDGSGLIEVQELIEFFRAKYPEYKEQKIIEIVQNIDKNNSGKIDFNEFITAMAKKTHLYAEQALKEAFEYVDKDKTGFITKHELTVLLKLGSKQQIKQIFEHLDENGDNQISFEEFKTYLLNA